MNNNELISSGELELYVAGLLSEERSIQISEIIEQDNKVRKEVEEIENVVMRLAKESTTSKQQNFSDVLKKIVTDRISDDPKVVSIDGSSKETEKQKPFSFSKVAGWAAAAVFLILFGIQFQNNDEINKSLNASIEDKEALQDSIQQQQFELNFKENLLATITSENTKIIELAGQDISPASKVKVFWDTDRNKVVIDAKSLPEAPQDMVYQVWSLKLEPLTPTSLGLLENYSANKELFVLENTNASEAFGITLEPAGGSKTPTLEKLYVLGTTGV
jgi:anti-sigma-K factor RskA